MNDSIAQSYDRMPYITSSFPETHPRRLRTVAMLYGLDAPALESARVLELGCAGGGNLLPMAAALPGAKFVGIDISARQIEAAQQDAQALGLSNVEFRQMSIADVTPEFGQFDYILCHGVYSWVPRMVQDAIMRVCRENLSPSGLAYVSYNIFPGWHLQTLVRDIMLQGATTASADDDVQRVRQGREFLKLLVTSPLIAKNLQTLLSDEAESIVKRPDAYLAHEYLEEYNDPIYFRDFTLRAAERGLQYVGDARLNATILDEPWPAGRQALGPLANDPLRLEQFSDFLRNRMFRRSILCHADVRLDRAGAAGRVPGFALAANLRRDDSPPAAGQPAQPDTIRFVTPRGGFIHTSNAAIRAVLTHLMERFPQAVSFETLYEKANAAMPMENLRQVLCEQFYMYWKLELVELHASPPALAEGIPPKPLVSALARHQAKSNRQVTTLRHEMVNIDDTCRQFLQLVDGTRTREDLARQAVGDGLMRNANGTPAAPETALTAVDQTLNMLAKNAMLGPVE